MKIYFAGSIRGGRDDKELYSQIIGLLARHGEVLTEHVGDQTLSAMGEAGSSAEYIYDRDMRWLAEADAVVAEVTTPSLGVGYEVAKAENLNKRTLCLFRPAADRRLSAMIAGNRQAAVLEYRSIAELEKILSDFFARPA